MEAEETTGKRFGGVLEEELAQPLAAVKVAFAEQLEALTGGDGQ